MCSAEHPREQRESTLPTKREELILDFRADVAHALSCSIDRIEVLRVRSGSIVMEFQITAGKQPQQELPPSKMKAILVNQIKHRDSVLYQGKITAMVNPKRSLRKCQRRRPRLELQEERSRLCATGSSIMPSISSM